MTFDVHDREEFSWVALRHFPQMHTNPVNVIVGGKPIRASREQRAVVHRRDRAAVEGPRPGHRADERDEAEKTFQKAMEMYKKIAEESGRGELSLRRRGLGATVPGLIPSASVTSPLALAVYFFLLTPRTICHSPRSFSRSPRACVQRSSPRSMSTVAGSGFAASSKCGRNVPLRTVTTCGTVIAEQPLRALRHAPAARPATAERRRRVRRRREHVVDR